MSAVIYLFVETPQSAPLRCNWYLGNRLVPNGALWGALFAAVHERGWLTWLDRSLAATGAAGNRDLGNN